MKSNLLIYSLFLTVFLTSCGRNTSVVKPQRKDLTEMIFASGILEADAQYNLTAQTDGYLVSLTFKEGDLVNQGQLLALIDNNQNVINSESAIALHRIAKDNTRASAPSLRQISANVASAAAKLKLDQEQADRYKRLYENNSVSKLEYENAQLTAVSSKASLDAVREQYNNQEVSAKQQEVTQRFMSDANRVVKSQNQVRVVATGRVYDKKKQLGDYVKKGDVIAVIGNPNLIYARLNVDETNMAKLKTGQEVIVQLNTDKARSYRATLHQILPLFDAASQSFQVKAYFTDSLDFRITGTQLQANVIIGEKKNALVIPRNYLGYGNKVSLKDKTVRIIKPGIISSDWVEVLSGLSLQDIIINEAKK